MKVISWNVNGIRAIYKKNFLGWFKKGGADIICLQEIKAQEEQIPKNLIKPKGYHVFFNFAKKPGYSGVAVFCKEKPAGVKRVIGHKRFDSEGRFLQLKFKDFTLINLYLPHGGRDKKNLNYKLNIYNLFFEYLKKRKDKKVVLIGDFNVAHTELDLARPRQNQHNIMFSPNERKRLGDLVKLGFTDTFRMFHADGGHYTWWPYFANARARNLGWRIDYCFTSKSLAAKINEAFILSKVFGSDHCPIGIEI